MSEYTGTLYPFAAPAVELPAIFVSTIAIFSTRPESLFVILIVRYPLDVDVFARISTPVPVKSNVALSSFVLLVACVPFDSAAVFA